MDIWDIYSAFEKIEELTQRFRGSLFSKASLVLKDTKFRIYFLIWISKSFHLSAPNFPPCGGPDMRMQLSKSGDIAFPRTEESVAPVAP